ncbi:hypothetical protein HELRODRAFT_180402 [Helobdella robusta]|uniref:Uncharacterized protein n=1 Tax=Helobdella robusta TaxID=6412 RepID=T1FFV7_HELRO|nr:hypothetical protein HELRODRAFT_180402 [Helobdella robusta]ESN93983.1 hypothetical protein HELRODRAFT_180402 [Helobdella robusta]
MSFVPKCTGIGVLDAQGNGSSASGCIQQIYDMLLGYTEKLDSKWKYVEIRLAGLFQKLENFNKNLDDLIKSAAVDVTKLSMNHIQNFIQGFGASTFLNCSAPAPLRHKKSLLRSVLRGGSVF